MYPPGGQQRQPEMDFDQVTARFREGMGRFSGRFGGGGLVLFILGAIVLAIIVWAGTGVYTIGPGENAALRLFGAVQGNPVTQEGLHWWWPTPIGKKDVVLVTETRRMELGFRSNETGAGNPFPTEALMISGDLNIVDVQMVVQYNIKSLNNFSVPGGRPGGGEPGDTHGPGPTGAP